MSGSVSTEHADTLTGWLRATPTSSRVRGHRPAAMIGRLRFAFYGRISTREYQDPASSQAWQLDSATQTIAGRGQIMTTYFDVGCSPRLPWTQRP